MNDKRQHLIDAAVEDLRLAHRSSPGSEWREAEVRRILASLIDALPAKGWESDTP